MAHHSDEAPRFPGGLADLMRELGATQRFPEGKLDPSDQGEIRFGVSHQDGKVVLGFGSPVAWVGMTPDQADELAALLIARATAARIQLATMRVTA